jgi:hypothetical protein
VMAPCRTSCWICLNGLRPPSPPVLSPLELRLNPQPFKPNTGRDLQREPRHLGKTTLSSGHLSEWNLSGPGKAA